MITVSHNEVVVACQKAFEALGFDQGHWEDAGDAIGWLAVHGLPLPADFINRLDSMEPAEELPEMINKEPGKPVWEANLASAISYFPILADYASVHANRFQSCQMLITNCRDIDIIWPYAIKVHQRGFHVSVRWKLDHQTEQVVEFGSQTQLYHQKGDLTLGVVELEVSKNLEINSISKQKSNLIDDAGLHQNFNYHTEHGIDIDDGLWEKLNEIGKGILVEATEESEKRGAGGV